jgi:hypothetical protein
MQQRGSTFARLTAKGAARVAQYDRYQLTVSKIYEGELPPADAKRLWEATRTPQFLKAMEPRPYQPERTEGDVFFLSLRTGGTENTRAGVLDTAPDALRHLAAELLALPPKLKESKLAHAFLRGAPIEPKRLAQLRQAKQLYFLAGPDASTELQPALNCARQNLRDFCALDQKLYDQLLARAAPRHEFVLTAENQGYQIILFQAAK